MIQKITQNNGNFCTFNVIMRAKIVNHAVVRFSGTPYRLVPSQKKTVPIHVELGVLCIICLYVSLLKHALKLKRHTVDLLLLLMYPARGGLDWGQVRRSVI